MTEDVRQFIAAIGEALGPGRPDPDASGLGPPESFVSRPGPGDAARFLEVLGALGGEGTLVASFEGARAALREILATEHATSAVRWRHHRLDALCGSPEESEAAFGCRIEVADPHVPRAERVARSAAVDAGIVVADFAIAATGTVVHRSGGDRLKSVSLLPPILIAVVERRMVSDILSPAIGEIRAWLSEPGIHQGLQMISGPSRSSDIENDLTIGVHGPGKVHVLILGDGNGVSWPPPC